MRVITRLYPRLPPSCGELMLACVVCVRPLLSAFHGIVKAKAQIMYHSASFCVISPMKIRNAPCFTRNRFCWSYNENDPHLRHRGASEAHTVSHSPDVHYDRECSPFLVRFGNAACTCERSFQLDSRAQPPCPAHKARMCIKVSHSGAFLL